MGPLDSLNHLLNFLAPAFWMALFMAMLGPLVLACATSHAVGQRLWRK